MFLVGYPRSGNTWACYLLAYCLNCKYDDYDDPGVHPRDEYQRKFVKGGLLHASFEGTMGGIFKTHALEIEHPAFRPLIYVIRDGRDVMVSYFHYKKEIIARPASGQQPPGNGHSDKQIQHGLFSGFVRKYTDEWVNHVDSWMKKSPDCIIKYENLLSDPVLTLKNIFETLDVDVHARVIRESLGIFDFQIMSGRKAGVENNDSFFRKGVSGDWKNYFIDDDLDYFYSKAKNILSEFNYI